MELTPTFGWPKSKLDFLLAGGEKALIKSIEGAEDDMISPKILINKKKINSNDIVFGLAASGDTKFTNEILELERKITIFHAKIIQEFDLNKDSLIGFHGQTIYHNSLEKISNQLGDAKLLNQLTKRKIIFNFRQKDISNGGDGAPLTPLFHQLIATKKKINCLP